MKKAIPLLLTTLLTLALAGNELSNVSSNPLTVPVQNIWGGAPKSYPSTPTPTDDSLWIKVDSIPLPPVGASDAHNGLKVYGDTVYLMWNRQYLPWLVQKLDRLTGALLDTLRAHATEYAMSAVRVDDSIYVTMFSPSNHIDVYYGPTGALVRTMNAPSGYMCRGMDWDGSKFWVGDNNVRPARIYTMTRGGTLLRTLTNTGTPSVGWIMDLTIDPMIDRRIWLIDNIGNVARYISFDTIANTYRALATFTPPGGAGSVAEGIGFYGPDTIGSGYVYTEGADTRWAWKMKVHAGGGVFDHDMGVTQILAPGSVIPSTPLAPRAEIKNFGTNPESDIPVYCWIDSAGTRVYNQSFTYPGPLAPNATAEVTFSPDWTPGGDGATYQVTMFTDLSGDEYRANDTMRQTTTVSSTVFSDTIIVRRTALDAPVIDGQIQPGEWNPSLAYDISDLAGRSGTPRPPGSSIMYFLYNDSFVYLANDIPAITVRGNYDQFGPYIDEDRSGTWSTDSSEGNHWIEYVGADSVVFRALLSTVPQVWRMPGQCPGCLSVSSTISGHLQIEAKIPIGTDKGDWNISPGDTVGYFQYTAQAPGNIYWGWWPQSLMMVNWANPAYYGTMIFSPTPSIAEDGKIDAIGKPFCEIYPNPIQDFARIHFSTVKSANVELTIYDITGKAVRTLIAGLVEPGNHYVKWDRTNDNGARVANGAYFYRLTIAGKSFVGKSIILK